MANTPMRTFRCPDSLWTWAHRKAKDLKWTISQLIRAALLEMARSEISPEEAKKLMEDNDDNT